MTYFIVDSGVNFDGYFKESVSNGKRRVYRLASIHNAADVADCSPAMDK
jgi:hypothetical protein